MKTIYDGIQSFKERVFPEQRDEFQQLLVGFRHRDDLLRGGAGQERPSALQKPGLGGWIHICMILLASPFTMSSMKKHPW